MPFDVVQWQQFYPSIRFSAMFTALLHENTKEDTIGGTQSSKRKINPETLLTYDEDKREPIVQTYLCEHISHILKLPIAKLNILRPIHTSGIDSLMAVELKNQIETDLHVTVPVVILLQGTTIAQLSTFLINELEKHAVSNKKLAYVDAGN
jgi:acyl carrier protein